MEFNGKKVLVIGFGNSGEAAARLLASRGARVLVIDEATNENMKRRARRKKNVGIRYQFGVKTAPKATFDAAILSPGIHPRSSFGGTLANVDAPVFGELELGSWFCSCPMVAITGTNGKTTTTQLVERALRAAGKRTLAAGNIGLPISEAVLQSDRLDFLTLEVSSFQLEAIDRFRPKVSVMMNITPDHLDRYHGFNDYAVTKAALWKNQAESDVAVVNLESERLRGKLGHRVSARAVRYSTRGEPADFLHDEGLILGSAAEAGGGPFRLSETHLRGEHNAENVMAALAVIHALGLDMGKAWEAIQDYRPLPHRLETVGSARDIEFVNDSKATNLDAMHKAVGAFRRPVVLIAGGKDKGFDFREALPFLRGRVRAAVLIGEMRARIHECWRDVIPCRSADSLEEAVRLAAGLALPDDVVLLSPGCSSYDMFENYEERGDVFRRAVKKLLKETGRKS